MIVLVKAYKTHLLIVMLFLVLIFSCSKKADDLPLHNKKVLILGNSITQNGTYVDFLEYYLRKNYPAKELDIISIGLSSETVSGDTGEEEPFPRPWLHSRLEKALKLTKPDLVLACYGINDGNYAQLDQTKFKNYQNGIKRLYKAVKKVDADLILLTPTPFDTDPAKDRLSYEGEVQSYKNPYYKYPQTLEHYSEWLRSLDSIETIDLNTYLSQKLANLKSKKADSTFIPDAVHPNEIGHYYMAKKILTDLYPQIKLSDDVAGELNRLAQDSLFILIASRRQKRSEGWLEYIGYTRNGKTVKSNQIDPTIKSVKALDAKIDKLLED